RADQPRGGARPAADGRRVQRRARDRQAPRGRGAADRGRRRSRPRRDRPPRNGRRERGPPPAPPGPALALPDPDDAPPPRRVDVRRPGRRPPVLAGSGASTRRDVETRPQDQDRGPVTTPARAFCLVLHGHLPWVLHHGRWPHGEDWLLEAISETWLPLLR